MDDKETKPEFNHTFKVTRDGKETELHVVYFKMYYKYFFYYNSWIVELEQGKSFVNIAQYEQGGSGYPIIIKLSDKSSILYEKGVPLDCEFLGKINYKANIYDDEKNYLKSLYRKSFCWRSKLTQKLYFLDNKTMDDIKILKSEILLTNTKIEKWT